jgi:hypothetical protein
LAVSIAFKKLFAASALNPLVEAALAAMNARFGRQNGHMTRLSLSIFA